MRVQIREIADELGIKLGTLLHIYKTKEAFEGLRKEIFRTPFKITINRGGKEINKTQLFVSISADKVAEFKNKVVENRGRKTPPLQGWTNAALTCYKNRLRCRMCGLYYICEQFKDVPPPMKLAVIKLVKKTGAPPSYLLDEV